MCCAVGTPLCGVIHCVVAFAFGERGNGFGDRSVRAVSTTSAQWGGFSPGEHEMLSAAVMAQQMTKELKWVAAS